MPMREIIRLMPSLLLMARMKRLWLTSGLPLAKPYSGKYPGT